MTQGTDPSVSLVYTGMPGYPVGATVSPLEYGVYNPDLELAGWFKLRENVENTLT